MRVINQDKSRPPIPTVFPLANYGNFWEILEVIENAFFHNLIHPFSYQIIFKLFQAVCIENT